MHEIKVWVVGICDDLLTICSADVSVVAALPIAALYAVVRANVPRCGINARRRDVDAYLVRDSERIRVIRPGRAAIPGVEITAIADGIRAPTWVVSYGMIVAVHVRVVRVIGIDIDITPRPASRKSTARHTDTGHKDGGAS